MRKLSCKIIFTQKEYVIKQFLKLNNIIFTHNKIVHLDGSLRRPDFLIDTKFGKIILECDENQHKKYSNEEECDRMKMIYKDVQLLKPNSEVLFIRYNPDNYKGAQYQTSDRLKYLH
jgi:hypothetical protein